MNTYSGARGVAQHWETIRAVNLANWEDRVPIHTQSYGLAAYDDPAYLSYQVRNDLISMAPYLQGETIGGAPGASVDLNRDLNSALRGLTVCHLQCHIGTDSISLARAGAELVVGVDFSPAALQVAAGLAEKHGVDARWVESDVLAARAAVTAVLGDIMFDVVYTSTGTIEWLNDLNLWAKQVFELLKPGGLFYIHDSHPAMYVLDEESPGPPIPKFRYFPDGTPIGCDVKTSYSGDGILAHSLSYYYPHSISEIINALIGAGLVIEHMAEGDVIPWQFSPIMEEVGDGLYAWPEPFRNAIPVTFTLIARKPH